MIRYPFRRWLGTVIGGLLGLVFGGPVGALFGVILGQAIDRGLVGRHWRKKDISATERQRIQRQFFETTFSVMGHLAKADGRVSEREIACAESAMERMSLSPDLRRTAIERFNQGKATDFVLIRALDRLRAVCAGQKPLLHLFLDLQLTLAYADGVPSPAQRQSLETIRRQLQIAPGDYRRLERLAALQQRMWAGSGPGRSGGQQRRQPQSAPAPTPLEAAYATLGVEPQVTDSEVKRAYRRLMSQHHPDKLAARGVPEEALRMASRKTQEILRAYETITRARAG